VGGLGGGLGWWFGVGGLECVVWGRWFAVGVLGQVVWGGWFGVGGWG
jgi:hypothetical protein